MQQRHDKKENGFTILELLLSIVMIGILSAILIIAYNGITRQAEVTGLVANLKQAQTALALDRVDNSGNYPEALVDVNNNLRFSEDAEILYTSYNENTPSDFCLTGVIYGEPYNVSRFTTPAAGYCSDHEPIIIPEAPYITTASNSTSQITVSWEAVERAVTYQLEWADNVNFDNPTLIQGIADLEYAVASLAENTEYHFRLYAVNEAGVGDASSAVSEFTQLAPPQGAPTLAVATNSQTQITASWSAVTGATSYRLDYSTASNFSGATEISTTNTSRAVTGLSAGTQYYFRVYAVNPSGLSPSSNTPSATTQVAPPQGAATLGVTTNSTSQITASWSAVTGATSYRLDYSTASNFSGVTQVTTTNTSRAVSGLSAGTQYYFRVYGVNPSGLSTVSNTATSTTQVNPPAGAPTISASVNSPSQITATWTAVSGATSYRLFYGTSSTFTGATQVDTTATNSVVTGLSAGTRYYFRVYAVNASGLSPVSNSVNGVTTISAPDSPSVSASIPGAVRAWNSGVWARTAQGSPTSGNWYYAQGSISSSTCASGTTREQRARIQYNSPNTWGGWTGYTGSTTFYAIQPNSGYGIRFQVQTRCKTSLYTSALSSSGYGCRWRSGSTTCSGF